MNNYPAELQAAINQTIANSKKYTVNGEHVLKNSDVEVCENIPPIEFKPQNLTSPRAGFFASKSSKEQVSNLDWLLRRDERDYFTYEFSPAGRPEAEKARLVKECKSPTRSRNTAESASKSQSLAAFYGYLNRRGESLGKVEEAHHTQEELFCSSSGRLETLTVNKKTGELVSVDNQRHSPIARLSHRAWADEYRIRVTTNASPLSPPPSQAGDRHTKFLTTRAAKNILDSGAYVAAVRGGYSTFLTLTFNAEARERINSGESTIGAECSRFFDALQKMYQRGWSVDNEILKTRQGFKCIGFDGEEIKAESRHTFNSIGACEVIEPDGDKLDYLWVAEAPTKPKVVSRRNGFECYGEVKPNPHCHVLLRWNVEPYLFHDWAARIEALWGQGFAKLERIKNPQAASGYMLKALGYLLKGEDESDQGEIKGNRYNISKSARALPWENIASFHAEHMSSLIGEIKCKFENRAKPTLHKIKLAKDALKKNVRDKAFLKATKQNLTKVNMRIKAIEKSISDFKGQLRKSPVRAVDYMITFKGDSSLKSFLNWAVGVRDWNATDSSQKPEKSPLENQMTAARAGIRKTYSRVRNRFIEKQLLWREWLAEKLPLQMDHEKLTAENAANFKEYELCQMI